ncbi:Holliday junction resolvase, putative [Psychroflexus gondwanensis ACAM 44]|jgi:putative Holliday junction resolvase|uniref:Putative pre-16S rRNA nuclease n=1 Tax=Psychroflexus gondwanensis ACAM 44 TaxID=1189619 RepID=N1WYB7_9FLAO|nr:Holliday junction resolvase RuvX [Psychroflexus gondwanensis]EMY82192.1 Holliday junction resolvase, putative [Psychroflexus gondwanensis ACAM 44]
MKTKVIALDFGIKRTGIAISDEMKMIASGLRTVETRNLMQELKKIIEEESVDTLVVGQPKHIDGKPMQLEKNILFFIEDVQALFPSLIIKRIDERFTSKMAFQTMIDSGLKKKQRQNKGLVDEISATIILQNYLQYI